MTTATTASAHALGRHGGRLSEARALHPHAPEPWIDLSTGINPRPYPAPRASESARARLPDPERLRELEAVAARAFGVDVPERVVAASGSEAVLRLLPYVSRSEKAVVAGPTYSSHADAWRRHGVRVTYLNGGSGVLDVSQMTAIERGSTFTLVNPNNPNGAIATRERVLEWCDRLAAREANLVVDEAFADVAPECSVAAFAGTSRYERLVVLRSFGKFFGLAGVRLGFAVAAPAMAARFREALGDWPVSADAIEAGLAAYADTAWADRERARLKGAADRLDKLLESCGLTLVGGTNLFRLARCDDAPARFERLLRAGILVRPFDYDTALLRFGLPEGRSAWQRLKAALESS